MGYSPKGRKDSNTTEAKERVWDLLGGPVVKTLPSNAGGVGLIPGRRAKIPHALWPKKSKHWKKKKRKSYCNKFKKDFKMVHIKKEISKKRAAVRGIN